ncbi:MAG: transcriptional repressor LexA [Myxococcales bacterium]|nr:transcriptional repressor LexA [Myxococcales bacterium]
MKGLTTRQREILDFITASIDERGYPPTIREIGRQMGIRSTNGVNDHLKALERKGYLRRDDLKSRAMRPTHPISPAGAAVADVDLPDDLYDGPDIVEVPLLGRVAAGEPLLAVEQAEDTVRVDRVLLGGHRQVFALRIVGDSMIEDGIFDGDYVFVKKTPTAHAGDIVIALIDDEATCKRYYPEGDRIRFQPANARLDPIFVHRRDFRETMIIGRVVGVYRRV